MTTEIKSEEKIHYTDIFKNIMILFFYLVGGIISVGLNFIEPTLAIFLDEELNIGIFFNIIKT